MGKNDFSKTSFIWIRFYLRMLLCRSTKDLFWDLFKFSQTPLFIHEKNIFAFKEMFMLRIRLFLIVVIALRNPKSK